MKTFQFTVTLNTDQLNAARATTDQVRQGFEDALNAVGDEWIPQLNAAIAAEEVAGDAVSVALTMADLSAPVQA